MSVSVHSLRVHHAALIGAVRRGSIRQQLQPLAAKATNEAKRVAAERTQRRTGRYAGSFRSHVEAGRGGDEVARIVTENTAPYAGYIEGGTRAHIIVPRRARVLRFDVGGNTVFARRVNHPGTSPRRVIETALRRVARR